MPLTSTGNHGADTSPRGRQSAETEPVGPVLPLPEEYINGEYNNYLEPRPGHLHAGEDWSCPDGTPIYACEDGVVHSKEDGGYGLYIDLDVGQYTLRYAHLSDNGEDGKQVSRGDVIGHSNNTGSSEGPHLHFEVRTDDGGYGSDATIAPGDYLSGAAPPGGGETSGGTSGGGLASTAAIESIAKAASIATTLQLPGAFNTAESQLLTGARSLMNDQPLLPLVQQICTGSLRHFQSMPNGNFFAFYPDYFGGMNHRTPYWEIKDIEIIDGKIDLSDDALATHVFAVGDTTAWDGPLGQEDVIYTAGIVNVYTAFAADFINGVHSPALSKDPNGKVSSAEQKAYEKRLSQQPTLADKAKATAFLKKYGARPWREDAPMIRSHYYEMFIAYQTFCLMWSRQFLTMFELTFMPELFPGGLVAFPEHGIQCYIDEVVHECNYETGFRTKAYLSAPSALTTKKGESIRGDRRFANEGMVRAGAFAAEDF